MKHNCKKLLKLQLIGVISVIEKPPYYECDEHFCAADDDDDGSVFACTVEVLKFGFKWKKSLRKVLICTHGETVLISLCEWLRASGDLVYRSITFYSLDNRVDTFTEFVFDRQ